jgi:hypothetical protein
VLSLSGTSFTTDHAITGQASLSPTDGEEAKIAGPGAGPLAFSFNEVGGTRRMGPGYRLSCGLFTIEPGAPMTSELGKSGGWTADDPNASLFSRSSPTRTSTCQLERGPSLHEHRFRTTTAMVRATTWRRPCE